MHFKTLSVAPNTVCTVVHIVYLKHWQCELFSFKWIIYIWDIMTYMLENVGLHWGICISSKTMLHDVDITSTGIIVTFVTL